MKIKIKLPKQRLPMPKKAPKVETPKNVYNRKQKHKQKYF